MKRLIMVGCALLLSACTHLAMPEKPQVTLAGLEVEGLGLFEQHFLVTLRVSNPNDVALTIDGVEYQLELNDEAFARGAVRESITLPRMGDALVKLKVTTQLAGILKQLQRLHSGDKPFSYRVSGRLYTPWMPGGIAFERKGELPGFQPPDVPGQNGRKVEKL